MPPHECSRGDGLREFVVSRIDDCSATGASRDAEPIRAQSPAAAAELYANMREIDRDATIVVAFANVRANCRTSINGWGIHLFRPMAPKIRVRLMVGGGRP